MEEEQKKKSGSFLKGALKWTFRFAVIGIGIGIGSEILTELISFSYFHGPKEGQHIAYQARELLAPIYQTIGLTGWDDSTYEYVTSWFDYFRECFEWMGFDMDIASESDPLAQKVTPNSDIPSDQAVPPPEEPDAAAPFPELEMLGT